MEYPNIDYINQLAGSDNDFKNNIILILKKELPEEIEEYKKFLQNEDFKGASMSVHKLKHKISMLGLKKGYSVAEEFEESLKSNNSQLKNSFEEVLFTVKDFVNDL